LNVPQVPVGVQVQSTPAFAPSFVTVALTAAVPPTAKVEGAPVIAEIVTGVTLALTAIVATAVAEWVLVEVAVIVTEPPVPGAV
jgi:hypothetical protein